MPDKQHEFAAVVLRQGHTGRVSVILRLENQIHSLFEVADLRRSDDQIADVPPRRPHRKGLLFQCGIVRLKNAEFFGIMEIHQQSHIRRGHGVRQFTGITASRNESPQDVVEAFHAGGSDKREAVKKFLVFADEHLIRKDFRKPVIIEGLLGRAFDLELHPVEIALVASHHFQ